MARRHLNGTSFPAYHRGELLLGGTDRKYVCTVREWKIYERTDQKKDGRRGRYVAVLVANREPVERVVIEDDDHDDEETIDCSSTAVEEDPIEE